MGGVTYDTGALVAAERNNRQMWALHAGYLAEEVIPTVPLVVLYLVPLSKGWLSCRSPRARRAKGSSR
jgi:hypothetical protein